MMIDHFPGPHPTAMFEVQTMTPHQTGALFSWLAVNRGPLEFVPPKHDHESISDMTSACLSILTQTIHTKIMQSAQLGWGTNGR